MPRRVKHPAPLILVALIATALLVFVAMRRRSSPDTIEYLGETFELSRTYADYDEFKADPNNFSKSQLARIEELLTSAKSPASAGRRELIRFAFSLKVPGYGVMFRAEETKCGVVEFFSVEIPQTERNRVLVYLRPAASESFLRIDDFVAAKALKFDDLERKGDTLRYVHGSDRVVTREIRCPEQLLD